MKRIGCFALLVLFCVNGIVTADEKKDDGWISLWDGKTFKNWKASENTKSWTIKDGAFVAFGPRSHLFYVGKEAPFTNFHFKCEIKFMQTIILLKFYDLINNKSIIIGNRF